MVEDSTKETGEGKMNNMDGVMKEIVVTVSETDTREVYRIRQMVDGRIEFISGIVDVDTLPEDHKKVMIDLMKEEFNPKSEEVKK